MSRLRLLYVLDALVDDDVGDQVATLLERLPRSRFEPHVVGLGVGGSLGSRLRQMSVAVHRLELRGVAGAVFAVPRVRSLIRGVRVGLVHAFEPWAGAVARLAAPRRVGVFRSVRGLLPPPRTPEQRLRAWIERRAIHGRDQHLTVADPLAVDAVRRRFRVNGVGVIPECVDLTRVRDDVQRVGEPEAALGVGLEDGQRALLVTSDFQDRQVPIQILEGVATARAERPGLRVFFLGSGPEEGAARWHAEELRLEDSVVFLGATTERHTALLRVGRGLIDAGSWPGWSRGALQAMACGLPVLRWVEDDDAPAQGRYAGCTAGPADRVARDLMLLLDDGPERERLVGLGEAEKGRYDVSVVAGLWAELYSR